ncbi:MAG: hypothetical protein QM764_21825 [Chitinophagaceae bacterium]
MKICLPGYFQAMMTVALVCLLPALQGFRAEEKSPGQESTFTLVYLSRSIHYNGNTLAQEIRVLKSMDEVKNLVRKRIRDNSGLIVVFYKKNNHFYRWERNFSKGDDGIETEWLIVMGSRGNEELIVPKVTEFRNILQGKLVIPDTIELTLQFQSANFPPDQYRLDIQPRDSGKAPSLKVSHAGKLIIGHYLYNNFSDQWGTATLYNDKHPELKLADFSIFFPSDSLVKEWKEIGTGIRRSGVSADEKETAYWLQEYINRNYGYCGIGTVQLLMK